jgi:cob(I)alamin adenosyltransferase
MEHGYVQVYTGDGKGKTTATIGLVVRAVGAGLSVCIVQFIKRMAYHELRALERLAVPVHQFGRGCFIRGEPEPEDREWARRGLAFARERSVDPALDLLVLDEINVALHLGLLDVGALLELVRHRHAGLELVCTGRRAPESLIEVADLVTDMVNVKHYYDTGIQARDGIER